MIRSGNCPLTFSYFLNPSEKTREPSLQGAMTSLTLAESRQVGHQLGVVAVKFALAVPLRELLVHAEHGSADLLVATGRVVVQIITDDHRILQLKTGL